MKQSWRINLNHLFHLTRVQLLQSLNDHRNCNIVTTQNTTKPVQRSVYHLLLIAAHCQCRTELGTIHPQHLITMSKTKHPIEYLSMFKTYCTQSHRWGRVCGCRVSELVIRNQLGFSAKPTCYFWMQMAMVMLCHEEFGSISLVWPLLDWKHSYAFARLQLCKPTPATAHDGMRSTKDQTAIK